eukprot:CAMPEP_0176001354 /NCGR_PEP_ID=MMETSP0120_2-20121206/78_1 /TAXON_ID=160619 /ORGANISM="Kryptoperidinium foliaceum, Strain CCMP 1326" /LENGTH=272 /DNA_ID=CAMNT_0017333889 /DNA_START=90 /DNA_END=908 /DNA_ORIENTATION=+
MTANMAKTETADSKEEEKRSLRVAVGSKNPVKVNAVKRAMLSVLEISQLDIDLEVQGFDVPSGVSDQPFGDEETQLGAKARAEAAYKKFKEKNGSYPNLAFGLEGGLEWSSTIQAANGSDTLWCMAWMAIYGKRSTFLADCLASQDSKFYAADRKPICCLSKSGSFLLPSGVAKLVESGMELGKADDKVFGRVNSGQKGGTVGKLTNGLVDRTAYYEQALILALIPWIRPDVYAAPSKPAPPDRQATTDSTESDPSASTSLIGSLFCSSRKS